MNMLAFFIALGVLVCSLVVATLISKRQRTWYNVSAANPEDSERHVYRTGWDRMWRSDEAGLMLFHREDGTEVRIGKHWIIKIVEEE